ncbi:tRNA (uracil-5-)-methyltransferase [Nematocida sp. LUAm3]|nr:tRNA (uracil-5-)-methyltransferase [Nematocida sp. LUAm3]KAI5175690.1 tRNA (uracil-5-)-methyltransferase [Nematocida sp. LUAm2]KAI5178596.1 tRNA (uracil-5-)-methyltransferase [Nematocida sp. LUAm1]
MKTYTWEIHNIRRKTKRAELMEVIKKAIGPEVFDLSYRDNKPSGLLITNQSELPCIELKNKPLSIRRKKTEDTKKIEECVTPFCTMDYSSQLKKKVHDVQKLSNRLDGPEVEAVESPIHMGYRNKCEFTFGVDKNNEATLGFRAIRFIYGPNLVENASACTYNISDEMLQIVSQINEQLKGKKELIYNRLEKTGYLRMLMLRRIGEDLVGVLQINAEDMEELSKSQELTHFLSSIPIPELYVLPDTTIYETISPGKECIRIKGEKQEYEQILGGCIFSLQPMSFFQINIPVAEILVKTIKDHLEDKTILDVCCGSGTLGICIAKGTEKKVLGVEIDPKAVESARKNAERNKVPAEYYKGNVEELLPCLMQMANNSCTALLDPPRSGTTDKLLKRVCENEKIQNIFYVSCNYQMIESNLKSIKDNGFILKKIYALDMFPYTNQLECLFIFNRNSSME